MPRLKAYLKGNYWHIPLRSHEGITSIRTHDVGRKGSNLRLTGISKKTGKWVTVSWLIHKDNVRVARGKYGKTLSAKNLRTQKILQSIRSNVGPIKIRR